MSNHASSDQKNTRVDVQTDACSNSSGITMGNQASSEQQHTDTKMATSNLPTMSHTIHTYPLRGGAEDESEDEDDSDYDYSGSESEDESEGDSEDIGGDDEGEDVRSDGEAEDDCGTECEYEDEDGGAGNDSVITESAKNVADSEAPSVPAISGDNGLSRAKSVESSFSSSTTGTPPPCAPSQSQPFPLPSYDPITPLDPSIDLSLKGDFPPNAESESSPEPDFPSVKEMLAKTRPPPSQPANQKVQAQASAYVPVTQSQGDNSAGSLGAINHSSPAPLSNQQPIRPRPVARKAPTRIEVSGSSTPSLTVTLDDEAVGRNEINEKGKRKASDESLHSPDADILTENLDEVRPTKRSRLEQAVTIPRKHDQFWILDGNTVLEVGGILFKLHRSRLVDQSGFFAGLLDEQDVHMDDSVMIETDENGVVYHLSNTTPKDLEALLQLDKNPMAYYFTPPPFPVLAAILRAATALGFDTYRAFAVKLLENAWSSALTDLTTETKANAVEVVALARSCGVESVLKRAFYEMVRVAGYGLSDGELDGSDGEEFQEISRADERRLERMREHLISTWSQAAVRVDRSFKCPNQAKSRSGTPGDDSESSSSSSTSFCCASLSSKRDAWEKLVHDSGLYDEYQFDPLCGLQALIDIKWDDNEGWCSDCVRARREAWTRMRQRTWERVGVWMGLDN